MVTIRTTWTLLGAAALTVAALAGCSSTTDGDAVSDGSTSYVEPTSPTTPRPSTTTPTTTAVPLPTATAAPPPQAEQLPANEQGYVYIETRSGQTRCQLNAQTVGCESAFENSPVVDGAPANGVSVTSDGAVQWVLGNLGNIPTVIIDYRTYQAVGWTIAAGSDGTRFTNDGTGHGMFVAVQGVETF
ncbi:hypothetical protein MMUR_14530 [Mycolicibacterium murale]|uniref:Lipoprotein LpqJ n=1 Tax=Mycolicibacterium murale TaxID=182220 RepID=A0A7I9WJB5_9MYCO|nr:hypothetical protein [Mycolicibacterium murale]GFG57317.1 hypothetical protein MMUR_14530 [Mycolicibacterium murale]